MHMRTESIFGIIFSKDKKEVLLIKRRDIPIWVFPGGGVEKGESPMDATIREIKEETGLEVTIIRKVATYLPWKPFIKTTDIYECKVIGGKLQAGSEEAGVQFFPLNVRLIPPFNEFLEDALKNLPPIKKNIATLTPFCVLKIILFYPLVTIRFLLSQVGLTINSKK